MTWQEVYSLHTVVTSPLQIRVPSFIVLPSAHTMTGRGAGDAPQGPKQGDPAGPAGGTAGAAPGPNILVHYGGEGGIGDPKERSK